ncbi:dihydropteroate synthase [Aquifex aeolicus]|uniref:Dihydropteroate synthase n=1 Tax=Aquifex aeolicus (strain VF5) TaxID=224324 RepID=O67448_AQUAE|nr:dihydropteroate synthase [Aquifex aeolicus]AAC07396.1 dihydropteroate synthase [Aquifex aeolicus VF5]
MLLIKHFEDKDLFYKFLKEKIGVFFREAEQRAFEGIFHCVYFSDPSIPPNALFESARKSCVSIFHKDGRTVVCGSEAKLKDFCSELVKYPEAKKLAQEILESFIRYRKKYFQLNYNQKILPLGLKTAIMGVLNVTPDSFSDGGEFLEPKKAVERAVKMAQEGAEIIDIGGESTRPGSKRISAEEELNRVLPALKEVRRELPDTWISVDTYKAEVAKACLDEGADIINDVSGGTFDPEILKVVTEYRCPYVINHMKGRPETWKEEPIIYEDVVEEISQFFKNQINKLKELGFREEEKIILDPGIGFGKLPEHNVEILKRFHEFKIFGKILMVGVSRKSFIGLILEGFLNRKTEPKERLFGSLGALAPAVLGGASIVRVHDVKETREFLALLDAVRTYDVS